MYCNYYLEVGDVVAVVTEIRQTPENKVTAEIKAGYAFNKKGKSVNFWKLINKNFVEEFLEKWEL